MASTLTMMLLAMITSLAIALHLRNSSSGAPRSRCPHCNRPIPPDVARCPRCGIPQQVFEIVAADLAAEEASDDPGGDAGGGKIHAVVRKDVCVGCGTCVSTCPEPGAIRLDGKISVVDPQRCVGHGHCAEACPVSAIIMAQGAAVHRLVVPEVNREFQTNIEGLYIVGELGGRGLIKNAINEGRIAAESVAGELQASKRSVSHQSDAMSRLAKRHVAAADEPGAEPVNGEELIDLAIVGSGPAGLSAALEAHRLELRYLVLEQGAVADTIRKYPRHKFLMAEPVSVPLYGNLWIADGSKETLISVWESIIASTGIRIRTESRVEHVTRVGDAFLITGSEFQLRARKVILALGRRGTPRRLVVPGEDLPKVFYDIAEMEVFRARRVLVVGGGDSALESALGLANQQGTQVTLSYRGDAFARAKERNIAKLEAARLAGKINVVLRSHVREILPDGVVLETEGRTETIANDDVIVRVGGHPPSAFLEKVGVNMVNKEIPLQDATSP